jgi:hypothetical protein
MIGLSPHMGEVVPDVSTDAASPLSVLTITIERISDRIDYLSLVPQHTL